MYFFHFFIFLIVFNHFFFFYFIYFFNLFFFFLYFIFFSFFFFFSSRRRHTRFDCDWSSDVCSSDLNLAVIPAAHVHGSDAPARRRLRGCDRKLRFLEFKAVITSRRCLVARKPRSEERRVGKECRSRWAQEQ